MTRFTRTVTLAALATLAAVLASGSSATAASNPPLAITRADDPVPDPAAPRCLPSDCSLREAVLDANERAGADTVLLPSGPVALTLVGSGEDAAATGDLDVLDALMMVGAADGTSAVSAAGLGDRVLDVPPTAPSGTVLHASLLAISGGSPPPAPAGDPPGAGGGVRVATNGAALALHGVTLDSNTAPDLGGAIGVPTGTAGVRVSLSRSVLNGNNAGAAGGAIGVRGDDHLLALSVVSLTGNDAPLGAGLSLDAVSAGGSLANISDSSVSQNTATGAAAGGGGLAVADAGLNLGSSEVVGNTAAGDGGGLLAARSLITVVGSDLTGNDATRGGGVAALDRTRLTLTQGTVADNTATSGGGILSDTSAVTVSDSTVSGNAEGGVVLRGGQANLTNATFSGNTSTTPGAGAAIDQDAASVAAARHLSLVDNVTAAGGGAFAPRGSFVLANSLVARTVNGTACTVPPFSIGVNASEGSGCGFTPPTDLADGPLGVRPLGDFGGPTLTHSLFPGSRAIDAASAASCPVVDQRGSLRPQDGDGNAVAGCDIGAFEAAAPLPPPGGNPDPTVPPASEPDLAIEVDGAPIPLELNDAFDGRVAVTFNVPFSQVVDPATGIVVRITAGEPLRLTDVVGEGLVQCTLTAGAGQCALAELHAGEDIRIAVTAEGGAPGLGALFASVSHSVVDPVPENDTDALAVPVVADIVRVAGPTRLETAIAASQEAFVDGAAGAVVLARSDLFPDALAGTPFAVRLNAPLLLTPGEGLVDGVATELQRVLPTGGTVYLLGGEAALSARVAEQVSALGYVPARLGGANRFATAVIIADVGLDRPDLALLADGSDFPDSLVAGTAAATRDGAVLLTDGERMPAETAAHLEAADPSALVAIGGPAARAAPDAEPVVGLDRFDTATSVARQFFDDPTIVGIASGLDFPDPLSGGVLLGSLGGPMLLATTTDLPTTTAAYLVDHALVLRTVYVLGGVAALNASVEAAIADALADGLSA